MNFWNQLESRQITREQLPTTLFKKLGEPANELQHNLAGEILKKIISYYYAESESQNYTTYSLFGYLNEISQKKYKEGRNKGQTYYALKLGGPNKEILHARKENLAKDKWEQIEKMALLGKNLVFKYKKWINNKQLLDFSPPAKTK